MTPVKESSVYSEPVKTETESPYASPERPSGTSPERPGYMMEDSPVEASPARPPVKMEESDSEDDTPLVGGRLVLSHKHYAV